MRQGGQPLRAKKAMETDIWCGVGRNWKGHVKEGCQVLKNFRRGRGRGGRGWRNLPMTKPPFPKRHRLADLGNSVPLASARKSRLWPFPNTVAHRWVPTLPPYCRSISAQVLLVDGLDSPHLFSPAKGMTMAMVEAF
jgi:hypothetical protein